MGLPEVAGWVYLKSPGFPMAPLETPRLPSKVSCSGEIGPDLEGPYWAICWEYSVLWASSTVP